VELHRTRLGVTGQPYENLKFNFITSLDFIGKDALSGTEGGLNNGGSPRFRVWNAFLQFRLKPNSEAFNIVAGYFSPQIGRESITAAMRVTSMEKAWSQNYLRRHLVGTAPGRAVGINFGGLVGKAENPVTFKYDIGVFNPVFQSFGGNSSGQRSSPLFSGRWLFNFGDMESKQYGVGHKINYFGKRNGLSVAISGARQGNTDLFDSNTAIGGDFLLNFGNLNFDGDWHFLQRESGNETMNSNTGYLRLSYNFETEKGYIFEPVLMWAQFNGETEFSQQNFAREVASTFGTDQTIDIGVNFYFNPNLKLSLHYIIRDGEGGDLGGQTGINNFFQSGSTIIQRGNWVGLGVVALL